MPKHSTHLLEFLNENLGMQMTKSDHLPFRVFRRNIKAGEIIIDFGQIEKNINFLNEGLIQVAVQSPKGEEKIVDFLGPGDFFSAYASFTSGEPSQLQIKALKKSVIEYSPDMDVKKAFAESLITNKLARVVIERLYLKRMKREIDFLTKTAEERYEQLILERPEIIESVPVKKVAQYLGLHPESLSRIRRVVSNSNS